LSETVSGLSMLLIRAGTLFSESAQIIPEPPDQGGTGIKGPDHGAKRAHWWWKALNVGVKDGLQQKGLGKRA